MFPTRMEMRIENTIGINMLIYSLHSSNITDSANVCLAYPATIAAAPIRAYDP